MLNLDHQLVGLGSSDVMMVPVSMTIIAVMKLQIAVMVAMKSTAMGHLLPMVCEKHTVAGRKLWYCLPGYLSSDCNSFSVQVKRKTRLNSLTWKQSLLLKPLLS